MSAATAVLLAGLPGSGKTTLAKALEARGLARLSSDEEMLRRYGVSGKDYPRGTFTAREKPVLADFRVELGDLLASGRSVVFDHGLWTRAERDDWRSVAERAGGAVLLLHLDVDHDTLWARVQARNTTGGPSDIRFEEHDLHRFAERFEAPAPEENAVVSDGAPAEVLALLTPALHEHHGTAQRGR